MIKFYDLLHVWQVSVVRRFFYLAIILCISAPIVYAQPYESAYSRPQSGHGPFFQADNLTPEHSRTASSQPYDLTPPVITYTPLPDICTTGNRTLTATITDPDGVPTSGTGLPVLYYRINNNGAWLPITGVSIGSNQYTFTFGGAALPTNIVTYYIVAQDNASTPNVGAQPSAGAGGFTSDPPAASIEPSTPNFYVIQPTLAAGTYLVGAGQTYLTITDAVNAYNSSCLSGPVVFSLTDLNYSASETFPIIIYNPAASSTNTLTIKPNSSSNTVITGSSPDGLFKLYGADYVTFEGSFNFTTTRNLVITNTNTSANASVIWLGSQGASNGATNNTIRNCRINGNSGVTAGSTTQYGIFAGSGIAQGSPAEAPNNNNIFRNNQIEKVVVGIHVSGPAANETGTIIDKNAIGPSSGATNAIGYRGVWASNQANLTISSNTVTSLISTFGIGSDTDPTAGIIINGTIATANIFSNNVNGIRNTNVAGWQSFGICLQSSSANAAVKVYNNFIYAITGNGKSSSALQNGHGLAVLTGGGYGIYYNSVHLATNQGSAGISSCLYIGSGITGISVMDIRNNIFSNRQTTGTRYAVYSLGINSAFTQIDYNCYYSSDKVGFLLVNQNNLAAWQTATAADLNSNTSPPIFVSNTDLHLQLISPLNGIATPIAGLTTDIDLVDIRNATTPDIGADEIFPPACTGSNPGTITVNKTNLCYNGSILLTGSGFDVGLGISYQWESSTNNITYTPIAGEINPTSATPPSISVTTYYRLRVACSFTGGAAQYSNVITVTVQTPQITASTPGSRCGPGTVNLSATGNAGTTVYWYDTPLGGEILGTGNNYTTPSINTNTTYYAEAAYPGSNGSLLPAAPLTPMNISSIGTVAWPVKFNVLTPTKLISVDIYPIAIGEASNITIHRPDNSILATIPFVTNASGGTTAQVININVDLDVGNGYYLYTSGSSEGGGLPTSGLRRDISGASYPYVSSDIEITGNDLNNSYYLYYYRWKFRNACATSPRTAVTASITSASSISLNATSSTLCIGSSTTITASSSNTSFTYNWMPGNISGSSITVSPTSNTQYVVTATDGSCTGKDSTIITVVSAPSNVVSTPVTITKCSEASPVALNASGGITQVNVLSQDFNGPSIASTGWTSTFAVIAGSANPPPAGTFWTLRPNGSNVAGYIIKSNDSSQYIVSNANGSGSAKKNIVLVTPAFSTTGLTNVSLMFYHTFQGFLSGFDSVSVESSLDNVTWTHMRSWLARGGVQNFRKDTIIFGPSLLNKPTVYVRFRHTNTQFLFWAIDNVTITGNDQQMPITWSPAAGLFTDPGGVTPYTAGTGAFTVYANPASTTDFIATAAGLNGCEKKDTTPVVVRPLVSATISGSTAVCPLGPATISIALTGTAPWSLTYTDGTTPVTVNGINTSPYTFVVNPAVTTSFSVTALNDANCTALPAAYAGTATITVNPTLFSTWLGTSTDWNDVANWCGGVPSSSNIKDVVIPGSLTFYPVITDNQPVTRSLQINAGAQLTIQASGSIAIAGDVTNNGTLNNLGTITLNGTLAQSFPGGTGTVTGMNILDINKASGAATLNRKFYISGELKPQAGNIILTDTVTIGSGPAGTARIDKVGATASFTYNGAGKFTVERYIPTGVSHSKTWQLLSAPTSGQTVKQAWQEGAATSGSNPRPGYGTTFTSDLPGALGLGFDFYTPAGGSSIKVYNPATGQFNGISSTNAWSIGNTRGYMLFIRGDRSVNTSAQPAVPVVLRTTGKVYSPGADAPPSLPVMAGKLESVGNPYASAIDFINLRTASTGIDAKYYVWDPLLPGSYGYGAYQTISSANGYLPVPGNTTNYPTGIPYTRIQSGQAFFVYSTPGGTVNFTEDCKTAGSQQVFRPGMDTRGRQFLRAYLYTATGNLADGNALAFDPSYSNTFEDNDAIKLSNFGENFGILSQGQWLAVEARKPVLRTDTIYYQLNNLRSNTSYKIRFAPENLHVSGLQALLVDKFTRQLTPISLSDESDIIFEITSDPASRAPDRFYIIFQMMRPLPVTILQVDATRKPDQVVVAWTVEQELNIREYQVERSADGASFASIGSVRATGNSGYTLPDRAQMEGESFYRIRAVSEDGSVQYSRVVRVAGIGQVSDMVVFPNPARADQVSLWMTKKQAGMYNIKIINAKGQQVSNQMINFTGGTGKVKLKMDALLAAGLYRIDVTGPGAEKTVLSLVIQ